MNLSKLLSQILRGAAALTLVNAAMPALHGAATNGLVGYWSFDDGTLAERSGFTPAGTHDGLAVGTVAYIQGPSGRALDLTAANTAVKIKNSNTNDAGYRGTFDQLLYNSAQGFTIAAWVKGMPGAWNPWISKAGEATSGYQLRRHGADNVATFTLQSAAGESDPYNSSGVSFADGGWHHLAAIYDPVASQRTLYVDGAVEFAIYDANLDPSTAPGQCLVFGARNDDAASGVLTAFAGVAVDEVRIYNRALADSEATALFTPGIEIAPASLVVYTPRPDTNAVQITVPDTLLASGAVDVVVTSQDPIVAIPAGAVNGSLTIHFPAGGPGTQSFFVHSQNEGSTKFTYTSTSGWVNGDTTIDVWADLSIYGNTVFLDTFNVSADSTNLDFEIAQRQSGSAAPVGYASLAVNLVGNPLDPKWFQVGAPDANGWLRLGGEGTANAFPGGSPSVMVKHSFIESKHFLMEYDIVGYTDTAAGGWAGIKLLDSTGTPQFLNGGDGFGFMFSGDGSGLVFDGGNQNSSFPSGTFDSTATNHISFEVVTAGWDGSSKGQTILSLVTNGQPMGAYKINHNYNGNYISLYYALPAVGHPNVCEFDNLKVTIAPSAYANATGTTTGVGANSAPVTVFVPAAALATGGIDIVITSSDPTIAVPSGASGASLTLHFAKGGTNAQSFTAFGIAPGQTVFTLSSAQVRISGNVSVSVGFLAQSAVANPSFEDSYTPAWAPPGYLFMNRWTPNTDTTGFNGTANGQTILDFADNGLLPDRNLVAFIDNAGSFQQNLQGLAVGSTIWLQYRYNVSANSAKGMPVGGHVLTVSYNGKVIDAITNALPVETAGSNTKPWYFRNVPFVADAASGALEFEHTVTDAANAPATMLLDAITVVLRGADEVVIENPSFEASGKPTTSPYYFENDVLIAGWTVDPPNQWGVNAPGDPFCDNGKNPDQDLALFVQGAGKTVSQTISGFTPGERYQLTFAYNARLTGVQPQLDATLDDLKLMSVQVVPVGGNNPFYRTNLVFTANAPTLALKFANSVAAGDSTFLLDDVHITHLRAPSPSLKIQLLNGQLQISWPIASSGGFKLQTSSALTGNWTDSTLPVQTSGTNNLVWDTWSANQATFYRLKQ